jgi:hypothetical protein
VGNWATAVWFVNLVRASVVLAKTTVGASPLGLKPVPVMVIRLSVVFSTVL